MLDEVKDFAKKHRGKIVAGVITVTGMVIAYNCGTHEVIARLRGNSYNSVVTKNHRFSDCLDLFLDKSQGNRAFIVSVDIPRDQLVDKIAKNLEKCPEDRKMFNVFMTAKK